jgi:hypothetical protein
MTARPSNIVHRDRFLCGECAASAIGAGADVVAKNIAYGTPCEVHPSVAATTVLAGLERVEEAATERPRLELVTLAPPTLDAATHAKQALDLVASWTRASGEAPSCVDDWMIGHAVDVVDKIHRAVASKHK